MRFQIGQKVVAKNHMETFNGSGIPVSHDACPGYVGTVICTNVYDNPNYYTVDFHESGGLITDAHDSELDNVH